MSRRMIANLNLRRLRNLYSQHNLILPSKLTGVRLINVSLSIPRFVVFTDLRYDSKPKSVI